MFFASILRFGPKKERQRLRDQGRSEVTKIRMLLVLCTFQFLALLQNQASCYQYKVGDLDAWNIPTSANPQVYFYWAKYHNLTIGDSLLFIYPPSQDSLIQVTLESYNSCNLKDPILYMNNGNSLFNITSNGDLYFTSGVPGHCEKKQKLHIVVGNGSSASYSPEDGAGAPSYPTVFGSIPLPPSASIVASSSSKGSSSSMLLVVFVGAPIFSAAMNRFV